jgi:hypothetical protein
VLPVASACGDDGNGGAQPTATPPALSPSSSASTTPPAAAAIRIDQPAAGETVTSPFAASGTANVFEGALTIDVVGNAAGLVLCTRHVQATSGTGTPGDWSGTLAFAPPPSDAPATLRAYTFSAMDGSVQDLVERPIVVSAERPDIVIESPRCAEEVPAGSPLTVRGMALVFEAALTVEIRDASGAVVASQNVLAANGTEFSPWSATFDLPALGLTSAFYDVVAYSHSAMDGSVINEFPVQISVRP